MRVESTIMEKRIIEMSIYEYKVQKMDGSYVGLDLYKGKVLLIVNTAPKCGFAPQYEGLEKLYETYKDKGFEILDFPSNQFMNQAPGSNEEIKSFCELTYGTKFETFAKIDVNGNHAIPLYEFLKSEQRKDYKGNKVAFMSKLFGNNKIRWNFTKFLVDRNGNVVKRFAPSYEPEKIESFIKELL